MLHGIQNDSATIVASAIQTELPGPQTDRMSQKRIIARNVFWNWLGIVIDACISLAIAPYLVNHLGASVYGVWILIGSMSGYFGLLDLGVRSSVGRYIAFHRGTDDHEGVNAILSTAFAATAVLGILVVALMPLIAILFGRVFTLPPEIHDQAIIGLRIIVLNLALTFPLSLFDGTLWAHQRFDILNMIDIPASVIRAALTFFVISQDYGIPGLAAITIGVSTLGGITKAALSFCINRRLRIAPRHVTRSAMRDLFGYSLAMSGITISRMTRLQFAPMLIGSLLSPAAVTLYSIAKRLLDYAEKLFSAATGVLSPLSASLQAQRDEAGQQEIIIRGGRVATTLSLLFVAFCLTMGRSFIVLWMGPGFSDAYTLLVILALGECIPLSQMASWNMLLATARHKRQVVFQVADVIIAGCLAIAFCGAGVAGLCAGIAAAGCVFRGAAVLVHACRASGVTLRRFAMEAVRPAVIASGPGAAFLVLVIFSAPPSNWLHFLVCTAVFAVLSTMAALAAAGVKFADLLRIPEILPWGQPLLRTVRAVSAGWRK